MTIIKGIHDHMISITIDGKETILTPHWTNLNSVIFFDDTSAITIKFDYFEHCWRIGSYYKGKLPAVLNFCSLSENSDTYETHAKPEKIRMLDKCAIEMEVMFNDL